MSEYTVIERLPTPSEYQKLRELVGWGKIGIKGINIGLRNSLFSICVMSQWEVIGCARVIGDGGMYFYIQDIIVIPEFQGKGVGKLIMDRVMDFLNTNAYTGSFVGLMAAPGTVKFYEKYGFKERPIDGSGMYCYSP